MRTSTLLGSWGFRALMVLAGWTIAGPAHAGWQSPFELTCFRKHQPQTVYYMPAPVVAASPNCCNPPVVAHYTPPQICTTNYVAKTYYQPVTTYQAQTYSEPCTQYRTSYYYEPVTSYRYSYAYDPCNCSYQTIATPQTSYALKAQTTPVTTYVQKTQMVPVTQYRQMTYYEPQQSCCTPTPAPAAVAGPIVPAPPAGVQENRMPSAPPAGVQENRNTTSPLSPYTNNPPANGTRNQVRSPANAAQPAVTARPDRVTSNDNGWRPVQATLAKIAIPE